MHDIRNKVASCIIAIALPASAAAQSPVPQSPPPDRQARVKAALQQGAGFLLGVQQMGRWSSEEYEEAFPNALNALVTYTLMKVGAPSSDPRLQSAARRFVNRSKITTVYARAGTLLAWVADDPEANARFIKEDVGFLTGQQGAAGGWGFGLGFPLAPAEGWTDHSNSQMALFALSEAAEAGAQVRGAVWLRAEKSWLSTQLEDGGWDVAIAEGSGAAGPSDPTMTAAGLASLYALFGQRYDTAERPFTGKLAPFCGREIERVKPILAAIDRAWARADADYAIPGGPMSAPGLMGEHNAAWLPYYYYSLSRAASASGRKRVGGMDWVPESAERLLALQLEDGSWGSPYQTALAMLALDNAWTPVLMSKLHYGTGNEWNLDPRDADKLTRWYASEQNIEVAWQIAEVTEGRNDLPDAAVVLITGHEPPTFTELQRAALRDHIWDGGTVLAVACCSRQAFADGIMAELKTILPGIDPARPPEDHPIWSISNAVAPGDDVIGFDDGCRTSAFVLKNGACCAWQQGLTRRYPRLFQMAGNILKYASSGKLPTSRFATPPVASPTVGPTLQVARLEHEGDWWADANSLNSLASRLNRKGGLQLEVAPPLPARSVRRRRVPLVFVTGHTFVPPNPAGRLEIRSYLSTGGSILATACCGRGGFDETFVEWAKGLFEPESWQVVPPDDPMITGQLQRPGGQPLFGVTLRPGPDGAPGKTSDRPTLYGIKRRGRWVLLYSAVDLSCGASDHTCLRCKGYITEDTDKIISNVLLYVAEQQEKDGG